MIKTTVGPCSGHLGAKMSCHVRTILGYSMKTTLLELAKFCSMDTFELYGDILTPEGQLETPGLVFSWFYEKFLCYTSCN